MPMIEPILVEVPNPAHPYGAKGVGEANIGLIQIEDVTFYLR
jgi:CO/xanthine dehydrogenase Mo-binding subunit